jgi:hypothetical protein
MATRKGFFKSCLFGCLGLLVFGGIFAGVSAMLAWRSMDDQDIQETTGNPVAVEAVQPESAAPGRVILKLSHGEFRILKAEPGEGLRIETRYDKEAYRLVDDFQRNDDGTWTYALDFRRTIPGLQAIFRTFMGADNKTYVYIHLPPEAPIALEIYVEEGGFDAEFGGLWLTEADIVFNKGGFNLDVDEPLREPMERLRVKGSMGGFEAARLGNASPRYLDVACRMGGADIDLTGEWMQSCDATISIAMGGMGVRVPENLDVIRTDVPLEDTSPAERELSKPVLRLDVREKMGEIEVYTR